jgi:LacI family transcriptional regulator
MGVTIKDVARKVGVTPATVSMVINHKPRISDETRSRVLAAIEEMDYFPHEGARSLVLRRTNTLGVAAPFFTNYFVMESLSGLEHEARKSELNLIFYGTRGPLKSEDAVILRIARERKVDGLVSISLALSQEQVALFKKNGVQVVCIEYEIPGCDSVLADNEQGAYEAARHLLALGHRRIALINGSVAFSPAKQREHGFLRALREASVPFDPALRVEAIQFSRDEGVEAGKFLMRERGKAPTAIFVAAGDICAAGLMLALRGAGVSVPGQVSIIGFDDQPFTELVEPGLTTVRQPIGRMGIEAFLLLKDALADPKLHKPQTRIFPTELVVRHSTGPA